MDHIVWTSSRTTRFSNAIVRKSVQSIDFDLSHGSHEPNDIPVGRCIPIYPPISINFSSRRFYDHTNVVSVFVDSKQMMEPEEMLATLPELLIYQNMINLFPTSVPDSCTNLLPWLRFHISFAVFVLYFRQPDVDTAC